MQLCYATLRKIVIFTSFLEQILPDVDYESLCLHNHTLYIITYILSCVNVISYFIDKLVYIPIVM